MKLLEKYEKHKKEINKIKETLIKELELSFSEALQKPEQKGKYINIINFSDLKKSWYVKDYLNKKLSENLIQQIRNSKDLTKTLNSIIKYKNVTNYSGFYYEKIDDFLISKIKNII